MAARTPKLDDQATSLFLASLASGLRSGQEPRVALELLAQDDLDPRLASTARALASQAAAKPLSEGMALLPRAFDRATVAMVREGEGLGKLADHLELMAHDRARSADLGPRLALALLFPLIGLGAALVVLLFMATFVVPAFKEVFTSFGSDLPALTLAYLGVADLIAGLWYLLIPLVVVVGLAFVWRSKYAYARFIDGFLLRMPAVGGQLRRAHFARMAGVLADAARLNVDSRAALAYLRDTAGNRVLADRADALIKEAGSEPNLGAWLAQTRSVPARLSLAAGVQKDPDRLATALAEAATQYAEAARAGSGRIERHTFIWAYVVAGLVVGSFVIAMYLPIFKMGSA